MRRSLVVAFFSLSCQYAQADYGTLGVFGGFSLPRVLFAQVDLNCSEHWGADAQLSFGIFWTTQQADLNYFFDRGEWSPHFGLGLQNWIFSGFGTYGGVGVGNTSAVAVTTPIGLLYTAQNGFGLDISVAADYFVNAPSGLAGRFIPEANLAIGYFF